VVELAEKVTEAPSLDVVVKDLKEIKKYIQNQSRQ
jgi:hypothetical protein